MCACTAGYALERCPTVRGTCTIWRIDMDFKREQVLTILKARNHSAVWFANERFRLRQRPTNCLPARVAHAHFPRARQHFPSNIQGWLIWYQVRISELVYLRPP